MVIEVAMAEAIKILGACSLRARSAAAAPRGVASPNATTSPSWILRARHEQINSPAEYSVSVVTSGFFVSVPMAEIKMPRLTRGMAVACSGAYSSTKYALEARSSSSLLIVGSTFK